LYCEVKGLAVLYPMSTLVLYVHALFVYEDIPYIKLKMHVRGCVNYKIGKPHKTAVFVWRNQVVSKFAVFLMVYMIHIVSSTYEIPA